MAEPDMSEVVTRGILKEVLAEEFAKQEVVTRAIVREELSKELSKELSNYPTRDEFRAEFARHSRAMEEMFRHYFGVLDDKLTAMIERSDRKHDVANEDLDTRVTRLEAAVFPPKRRRRS